MTKSKDKDEKLLFDEPPKKPRGWYVKIAKRYIEILIEAVNKGTATTKWLKIPSHEYRDDKEKMRLYNAVTSLKRRNKYDVEVHIIENNLWIFYKG